MSWHIIHRGLSIKGNEDIYKPGEDSLLLSSTIEKLSNLSHMFAVDFGTGSGVISMMLGLKKIYTVGIDISFTSCRYAFENTQDNKLDGYIDIVCSPYYLDIFRRDITIVVFSNPPYLPVDYKEPESISWAGGRGGLEIIRKIFLSLSNFKCFQLYLIISSYTDLNQFKNIMENFSFNYKKLDIMFFPSETIYLYRIWRRCE